MIPSIGSLWAAKPVLAESNDKSPPTPAGLATRIVDICNKEVSVDCRPTFPQPSKAWPWVPFDPADDWQGPLKISAIQASQFAVHLYRQWSVQIVFREGYAAGAVNFQCVGFPYFGKCPFQAWQSYVTIQTLPSLLKQLRVLILSEKLNSGDKMQDLREAYKGDGPFTLIEVTNNGTYDYYLDNGLNKDRARTRQFNMVLNELVDASAALPDGSTILPRQ